MSGPYHLTAIASLSWHSADRVERDRVRAEVRAACRLRLAADPHAIAVEVRDVDGRVLERVERSGTPYRSPAEEDLAAVSAGELARRGRLRC